MHKTKLLTVPEVADRLRVNPESVRRWLRAGKLDGFRIGGTKAGYRVSERSLAAFVRDREKAGKSNG